MSTYLGYCDLCTPGKYSPCGAKLCSFCDPGKYSTSPGSSACQDCPMGTFSIATGQRNVSTCAECEAGKYSSLLGASTASDCLDCPLHSLPASAKGASECLCEMGFVSNGDVCTGCAAGKFKSVVGPGLCSLCACGTYSNFAGATSCSMCPRNASTAAAGATMCECNAGFTGAGSSACTACVAGTYKSTAGSSACLDPSAQAYAPAGTDVIVKMMLGLPINPQEFFPDVQVKLRFAIARTAQVALCKVNIVSFQPADLRRARAALQSADALLSDSQKPLVHSHIVPPPPPRTHVKVNVDVAAQNSSAAFIVTQAGISKVISIVMFDRKDTRVLTSETFSQNLSPVALMNELASEQLPAALILEPAYVPADILAPVLAYATTGDTTSTIQQLDSESSRFPAVLGAVLLSVLGLCALLLTWRWYENRCVGCQGLYII